MSQRASQRSWYLRNRSKILKRQNANYRQTWNFISNREAQEACKADPRKIRDVAGDSLIVCPGTPEAWCGRLFSALKAPHLQKHYPQSDCPADDFRKDWQLPKTFSLMSKNASARNAGNIKVHPFTDLVAARAAGKKGGKATGEMRHFAKQNVIDSGAHKGPRLGGRKPNPKKQKFSEEQLRKALSTGLTIKETAALLRVRSSSIWDRAQKLKLDTGAYGRDKSVFCKILAALRKRYRNAKPLPTADQVMGWCGVQLRRGGRMAPDSKRFMSALAAEVTSDPALIAHIADDPSTQNNFFEVAARVLRAIRNKTAKLKGGRPSKREIFLEAKQLRSQGWSFTKIARSLTPAAFREDPRRAAKAIWQGISRLSIQIPTP